LKTKRNAHEKGIRVIKFFLQLTPNCASWAKSARLIASKMLGGDSKYPDEQLWDAVGELCNVIAGNFENKLTRISERCMRSVPTVITGATTAVTHWRTPVA
jgi:CheY-specific phosphatase CheX